MALSTGEISYQAIIYKNVDQDYHFSQVELNDQYSMLSWAINSLLCHDPLDTIMP